MKPIPIGNFDYTLDDKGQWIYKAKESTPLASKKVKPKYKEKPQYKLQEVIEQKSQNRFKIVMNHSVIELTEYIKNNLK